MSAPILDSATLFGLCGAVLVGIGLYGIVVQSRAIRRVLAFNLLGGGVFLMFGVVAKRGATAFYPGDPVPQALVITGIVVAFCATALAITLLERLAEEAQKSAAPSDPPAKDPET